jgi:hypothetical protein
MYYFIVAIDLIVQHGLNWLILRNGIGHTVVVSLYWIDNSTSFDVLIRSN